MRHNLQLSREVEYQLSPTVLIPWKENVLQKDHLIQKPDFVLDKDCFPMEDASDTVFMIPTDYEEKGSFWNERRAGNPILPLIWT